MKKTLTVAIFLALLALPNVGRTTEFVCTYPSNVELGDWTTNYGLNDVTSAKAAWRQCRSTGGAGAWRYTIGDVIDSFLDLLDS